MPTLSAGRHRWTRRACAMEAVALYAGEDKTDQPETASPFLTFLIQGLNDRWHTSDRQRLITLVPTMVNTRDDHDDERLFAFANEVAYHWVLDHIPTLSELRQPAARRTPLAWYRRHQLTRRARFQAHIDALHPITDQQSAEAMAGKLFWLSQQAETAKISVFLHGAAAIAGSASLAVHPDRIGQLFAGAQEALLSVWPDDSGPQQLIKVISSIAQPTSRQPHREKRQPDQVLVTVGAGR